MHNQGRGRRTFPAANRFRLFTKTSQRPLIPTCHSTESTTQSSPQQEELPDSVKQSLQTLINNETTSGSQLPAEHCWHFVLDSIMARQTNYAKDLITLLELLGEYKISLDIEDKRGRSLTSLLQQASDLASKSEAASLPANCQASINATDSHPPLHNT